MVPKLRFKEFCGKWEEKTIGDILKIKHGKDQKGIEVANGKYPILGTGGVIGRTNTPICTWSCVLIGRKGTIDKPQYMDIPFWTVDTLFYSKSEKNNDPKYEFYLFQTINWMKYNEASGVPSFSAKTIQSIKVKVPSLPEQTKIADFLSTVDDKIQNQQDKITHLENIKKGFMQKIFSRKIRFKDDGGEEFPEWEKKKLGDISKITTGNSNVDEKIENGKYRFFDRGLDSINYLNEYFLDEEAIIYPGEGSKFMPRYYNGKFALHQRCYAIYGVLNGINVKYLFYYMQTLNKYFLRTSVGTTVPSLRQSNFEKCKILLPSEREQQKIANFLSSFDKKISTEKETLEHLKQLKKGLLQQMFV